MSGLIRSYGPHPQTAVEEAAMAYDSHVAARRSAREHARECFRLLGLVPTPKAQELHERCLPDIETEDELPEIDAQEWLDAIAEASGRAA